MAERRSRRKQSAPPLPVSSSPNDKDFAKWTGRVTHARRLRRDWERRYLVEVCERFFLGNQHGYGEGYAILDLETETPTFNYIWATIQDQFPALYFQNPSFNVTNMQPTVTPESEQAAAMEEALLDTIAQEDRHLKGAAQLAVLQNYFRIAVLKVIYDPRMESNPQAGEIVWQMDPGTGAPVLDPSTGMGLPVIDPGTGEPQKEPAHVMTDEIYRWRWVDAACMLLPDQGPDPSRWTWIGEEVYVPLEVAQDDERFPARLRSQLVGNSRAGLRRQMDETGFGYQEQPTLADGHEEFLCYNECWDIWNKRYYIWAEGQPFGDEWLVNDALPDGVEDHPYCLALGFNTPILGPRPSPWPVPLVFQWLSIQQEYNTRRKQITEGARRSARKGLYEEGTFPDEDEAVKAMQSNDDMTFVKITNLERPPIFMQDPPLNNNILGDVQLLMNDWRAIAGIPASQMQQVVPGQSPTEAGGQAQFSAKRELVMREIVTEMLVQAGTKMSQRLKATMTLDKLVKIRQLTEDEIKSLLLKQFGEQIAAFLQAVPNLRQMITERFGREQWMKATREAITFASRVSVVPGSMRARTTEVERQQLLAFLNTLGQNPQIALSRELMRHVAQAFEIESEPLMDELNALAHQMVEINARQAGRYQGGDNPQSASPGNTPMMNNGAPPQVASRLAAALGGRGR